MYAQVSNLNHCIANYNNIDSLSNKALKYMYTRVVDEYNINRHIINRLPIVKDYYYVYVDNLFLPHINYMQNILIGKGINL
jgi:hypothetical protein